MDDHVLRLVPPIQRLETLLKSGGGTSPAFLLADTASVNLCACFRTAGRCVCCGGCARCSRQQFQCATPCDAGLRARFLGKVDSEHQQADCGVWGAWPSVQPQRTWCCAATAR